MQIIWLAIWRFFEEKYSYRVSALTFATLLALVPFLFVMVFFVTAFPFFNKIVLLGENYILTNFMPESASAVQVYVGRFIQQSKELPLFSILFLFVTALMLIYTIEDTLNDIWHVSQRNRKIYSSLLFWILILFMPFIIGLCIFWATYLFSLSLFAYVSHIINFLLACLPIFMNTLLFSLLYTILPSAHVRWRDGLLGGLIVSILFEFARIGFSFYILHFPSYALIYGAFAIIPIFLLWLYIFWCIVLFGALFVQMRGKKIASAHRK